MTVSPVLNLEPKEKKDGSDDDSFPDTPVGYTA